jgi:predicted dehydrogenase
VIDLGTHLVDLALWTLGGPGVTAVESRLVRHGGHAVEDYAAVRLELETGATVSLACSWNLPLGRDAAIEAAFYGARGGVSFRNVDGSFFDFVAERYDGRARTILAEPPDEWGGRGIVEWSRRLACGERYDPACNDVVAVAHVLDLIYGRGT